MFELNGSYSDVQKTKMKTASRSCFLLPEIRTLDEIIEERCWVGVTFDLDADIGDISNYRRWCDFFKPVPFLA